MIPPLCMVAAAAATAPPPLAEEPPFSAKPLSRASSKELVVANNSTLFLPSYLPPFLIHPLPPQATCSPMLHLLLQNPLPNTHTHAPDYSADSLTHHTLTGITPTSSQYRSWLDSSTFSCNSKQVSEESPTDLLDIAHSLPKTKETRLNVTQ